MDEQRRFVNFLLVMMLFLTGYLLIYNWMFPPPARKPPGARPEMAQPEQQKPQPPGVAEAEKPAEPEAAEPEKQPEQQPAWQPPAERRLIALGSLSPAARFRYLVIVDSRGATIQSIELNDRKPSGSFRYRDLDSRAGYMGNLGLVDTDDGGCLVQVVGEGTPAAAAKPVGHREPPGLQPGDVIVAIDDQPLQQLVELYQRRDQIARSAVLALERDFERRHRPGETITLQIRRDSRLLRYEVQLTERPMSLVSLERSGLLEHPESMLLSLGIWQQDQWHEITNRMRQENWETHVIEDAQSPGVEFRWVLDNKDLQPLGLKGPIEVRKRYRLVPVADGTRDDYDHSYHLSMDLELQNLGDEPQSIAYQLDGPTGLPTEGWWYSNKVVPSWSGAGARDVVWASQGRRGHLIWGCPKIFSNALKEKPSYLFDPAPLSSPEQRTLRYVGGDTQYFAVIVQPAEDEDPSTYLYRSGEARPVVPVSNADRAYSRKANTSFRLISEPRELKPQESWRQRFILFAGPKQPELLSAYKIRDLEYYGWFGFVSRPLLGILHLFEKLPLVNYGLAIIFLTVLVRGCMTPISRKAARNAQMMQLLQPELKKIAEKYKNDLEKRGRAQQELFRKYNYNPFGGCLLMFLQLPVFIGLYRGLAVDIALRDQPFIPGLSWCSNLAGPDKLLYWADWMPSFLASETGWLGPYLNVLPVITIVLFLVQQKLFTPPPTDEQQKMTQQVMTFMTVFIGVMFFKVASGLCIYFITSSLWSIAERKLLPKPQLPEHLRLAGGDQPGSLATSKAQSNGAAAKRKRGKKRRAKRNR